MMRQWIDAFGSLWRKKPVPQNCLEAHTEVQEDLHFSLGSRHSKTIVAVVAVTPRWFWLLVCLPHQSFWLYRGSQSQRRDTQLERLFPTVYSKSSSSIIGPGGAWETRCPSTTSLFVLKLWFTTRVWCSVARSMHDFMIQVHIASTTRFWQFFRTAA